MLLASCASTSDTSTGELVHLETSVGYVTNGNDVRIYFDSVDGRREGVVGSWTTVKPGSHRVVVEVEWSNGFREKVAFDIAARAKRKYLFGAFELKQGQRPADALLRRKSHFEEMLDAGKQGAAEGALAAGGWLIAVPVWLFSKSEHASKRPFGHCCFIWVEDAADHRLIQGTRPEGLVQNRGERKSAP